MSLSRIGVVGAGNMGSGIAQKIATEGVPVVMVDLDEAACERGLGTIKRLLGEGVERKIFTQEQVDQILSRLDVSTDLGSLADCDLVIEAVFEDLKVKQELFKKCEALCKSSTVLATNTSSFYVKDIAQGVSDPSRVIGLHFFFHPAKNRLLEVIPGENSSPEALACGWQFCDVIGKTGIASKDAPGFVVNRFFVPWLNEAVRILEEGQANIATIEAAAKQAFRIGMGPFQLMNVTGVPIAMHAANSLGGSLGSFYASAEALNQQVAAKQDWDLDGEVDDSLLNTIGDRLFAVVALVASQLVDEGVASVEDTDIGARVGLRWALGPFELINRRGIAESMALVETFAKQNDLPIPNLISQQAQQGQAFNFKVVDFDHADGVGTITINRPDALNSLNEQVVAQLAEAFDAALNNPDVKGIVLAGKGKAFVAGADIRYFVKKIEAKKIDDIVAFTKQGQELFKKIDQSPKPVICRLDGLSLGGGSELALCADKIIATEKGSMGFPETGIGIYPGLGGTQRTMRRIGKGLTKYLLYTGQIMPAAKLKAWGLVDEVVSPQEIGQKVQAEALQASTGDRGPAPLPEQAAPLAEFFDRHPVTDLLEGSSDTGGDPSLDKALKKVRQKAPLALKHCETILNEGSVLSLDEGLDLELKYLNPIFSTADAYEGLSSLGRRRPEFKGV